MHRSIAISIAAATGRRRWGMPSPPSLSTPREQHRSFVVAFLLPPLARDRSWNDNTSSSSSSSSSVLGRCRRRHDATTTTTDGDRGDDRGDDRGVRLSALLSRHLGLSRRQAERMILSERVTMFGKATNDPSFLLRPIPPPPTRDDDDYDNANRRRRDYSGGGSSSLAVKVDGRLVIGIDGTLGTMMRSMMAEKEKKKTTTTTTTTTTRRGKDGSSSVVVGDDAYDDDEYDIDGPPRPDEDDDNDDIARVWLANKLAGELVTEDDPVGRPSMLQRLIRGGVGKNGRRRRSGSGSDNYHPRRPPPPPVHLKPVGRLDMMTEGLMVLTNDGMYAREMELPKNMCWRTYRARVHGRLTPGKMRAMRNGLAVRVDDDNDRDFDTSGGGGGVKKGRKGIDNTGGGGGEIVRTGRLMRYKGIKVSIERRSISSRGGGGGGGGRGTNTWLRITCTEGKNRQLRRILGSLGLDVTRLIRISYGDYDLNTIPPGMAIEVRCKRLDGMKRRGPLFAGGSGDGGGGDKKKRGIVKDETASAVEWINYS